MEYEIVELKEKMAAGVQARANNLDPGCGKIIGEIWERFYQNGIYEKIPHKKNGKVLGMYTEYAGDEKAEYTAVAACEIENAQGMPEEAVIHRIPGGRYARFVIRGDVKQDVMNFWSTLWQMELPRSFVCDYEEYQGNCMENEEIHIYIGLKEE